MEQLFFKCDFKAEDKTYSEILEAESKEHAKARLNELFGDNLTSITITEVEV